VDKRYQLETLNSQHSIREFRCEEDDINDYLHESALSDMEIGTALTFVIVDKEKPVTNNVAGFFTLRAHSLNINYDHFLPPDALEDDEDEDNATIEVPLAELMFLARDLKWKGKGIGPALITDAVREVAKAADSIGLIGIHLRSTKRGTRLYKEYYFELFKAHPLKDGVRYFLPLRGVREIAQAE
jgi:ribosomal protein S18 acetylase RimI-like enzyme